VSHKQTGQHWSRYFLAESEHHLRLIRSVTAWSCVFRPSQTRHKRHVQIKDFGTVECKCHVQINGRLAAIRLKKYRSGKDTPRAEWNAPVVDHYYDARPAVLVSSSEELFRGHLHFCFGASGLGQIPAPTVVRRRMRTPCMTHWPQYSCRGI
jgi:hypothetical protein